MRTKICSMSVREELYRKLWPYIASEYTLQMLTHMANLRADNSLIG